MQPTQSLSSGEAETKAITKGAVKALQMKHFFEQQGYEGEIVLHSDASAAIGACGRFGVGERVGHIDIQDLWFQQLVRNKILRFKNIRGISRCCHWTK